MRLISSVLTGGWAEKSSFFGDTVNFHERSKSVPENVSWNFMERKSMLYSSCGFTSALASIVPTETSSQNVFAVTESFLSAESYELWMLMA